MEDCVHLLQRLDLSRIEWLHYIMPDKPEGGIIQQVGDIGAVTRQEAVNRSDFVTLPQQHIRKVRTDKTRAACNDDVQEIPLLA
jgi:hypothetical protein